MKLLRATFLSIRGLPDITCDFGDPSGAFPNEVVAITGPAGSGKTRMLEAILAAKEVLAPYGPMFTGESWIRDGESAAKIELTFILDADEQRLAGITEPQVRAEALFNPRACRKEADDGFLSVLERYEHDPKYGKVEYFPANRCLPPPGHPHGTYAIEQRLWRVTRDARKYNYIPRFLMDIANDAGKQQRFAAMVESLCPALKYVSPSHNDFLKCFSSQGRHPALLTELSTSESDAVIIAATASLLHFEKSIIFIDRPENGVEERAIVAWAKALRGLANDMQIIMATSSPALIASLDARSVLALGNTPTS